MDGHPASSKWTLFEAFVDEQSSTSPGNPEQWPRPRFSSPWTRAGGYYDSGFIQPVDFSAQSAIPMMTVSALLTGAKKTGPMSAMSMTSIPPRKFVERNWKLRGTLSERSRDNLANPDSRWRHANVPRNMPAIGEPFRSLRIRDQSPSRLSLPSRRRPPSCRAFIFFGRF